MTDRFFFVKIIVLLAAIGSVAVEATAQLSGYSYYKKITIKTSQIVGTHQNFPVLISLPSDGGLASFAQQNGADIRFATDRFGQNILNHEIELFNGTNGQLVAWVQLPTLSTTSNELYIFYGNENAVPYENPRATWDGSFALVQHLNANVADATSNFNNGVPENLSNITGKIAGGQGFNPQYGSFFGFSFLQNQSSITVTNDVSLGLTTSISISGWVNVTDFVGTEGFNGISQPASHTFISKGESDNAYTTWLAANGQPQFRSNAGPILASTAGVPAGQWAYISFTQQGTNRQIYINGDLRGSANNVQPFNAGGEDLTIGGDLAGIDPFDGRMDELRIANQARSANWIKTEYNNQLTPSNFYTLGAQQLFTNPGLSLRKSVTNSSPQNGGELTFELQLRSSGGATYQNVQVSDKLPSGFSFTSATASQGTFTQSSGTWAVNTLGADQTATLTIQGTANAANGTTVTNTARIAAFDGLDPVTNDNASSASFRVTANQGPAFNSCPAGYPVLNFSGATQTNVNGQTVYRYANVLQGVDALVTVIKSENASLTNIDGAGNANGFDDAFQPEITPGVGNGTGSVDFRVRFITTGSPTAAPVPYKFEKLLITAADVDGASAGGGTFREQVGFSPVSAYLAGSDVPRTFYNATFGGQVFESGTTVRVEGGNGISTVGTNIVYTLFKNTSMITIQGGFNANNLNINTPRLYSYSFRCRGTLTGNFTSINTDVAVVKTANKTKVSEGETLSFSVQARTISNAEGRPATNVQIRDVVPPSLTLNTVVAPEGTSYNRETGIWSIDRLPAGESRVLTLNTTIGMSAQTEITNTASVESLNQNDPNTGNNFSSASVTVSQGIGIRKTIDNSTPSTDDVITYRVIARKQGAGTLSNVNISDQLPQGVQFINSNATRGTYSNTSGIWSLGNLSPGAVDTLTINATVTATAGQSVQNRASLNAGFTGVDNTPGDNTAAVSFTARSGPFIVQCSNYQQLEFFSDQSSQNINSGTYRFSNVLPGKNIDALVEPVQSNITLADLDQENQGGRDEALQPLISAPNGSGYVDYRIRFVQGGTSNTAIIENFTITAIDIDGLGGGNPLQEYVGFTKILGYSKGSRISEPAYISSYGGDEFTGPADLATGSPAGSNIKTTPDFSATVFFQNVSNFVIRNGIKNGQGGANRLLSLNFNCIDAPNRQPIPLNLDINVQKTADKTEYNPDENIRFTLTASNNGGTSGQRKATGVRIRDPLPEGLVLVDAYEGTNANDGNPGGSPVYNSTTGLWNVGDITPGTPKQLTIIANANTNKFEFQNGNERRNSARLNGLNQVDSNGNNNSGSVTIRILVTSLITGTIFEDKNYNRKFDSDEAGINDIAVFLRNTANGTCRRALTSTQEATAGRYFFQNIPYGQYQIIEAANIPEGECPTAGQDLPGYISTSPNILPIVSQGKTLTELNFGDFYGANIAGTIFNDNGANGGTANDGIRNGQEKGLGKATVSLVTAADENVQPPVESAADGSFIFWVPFEKNTNTRSSLTLREQNVLNYISTGAQPGNINEATYTRSTDSFTNIALTAGTEYSGVNFGDVPPNTFITDGRQGTESGVPVFFEHTFTAQTAGEVSFSTTKQATPENEGWSQQVYRDINCNGQIDEGDQRIEDAITVAADEEICIIVRANTPNGAPDGAENTISTQASFSYTNASPALQQSYTRTDVVFIGEAGSAGLNIRKEADKEHASPGETITYTVTYTNKGSGSINQLKILDTTPAYTVFESASCTPDGQSLPNALTDCTIESPEVGKSGPIIWTFDGQLAPGATSTVTFNVTITGQQQ